MIIFFLNLAFCENLTLQCYHFIPKFFFSSGFLADPAKKWPNVFDPDGLFGEYPYLLASSFPFICCFLIFFLIFFKFDSTFDQSVKRRLVNVISLHILFCRQKYQRYFINYMRLVNVIFLQILYDRQKY